MVDNSTYVRIADEISFIMRKKGVGFDAAFTETMKDNSGLDWETTRREVGRVLGNRARRPRSTELQEFLARDYIQRDAARCAASLTAGIPAEDM